MRQWAFRYWTEGSNVDIAETVADIKAEIYDSKVTRLEQMQDEYISDD
jgi:hypothetical protein